jgi:hypothetical protein
MLVKISKVLLVISIILFVGCLIVPYLFPSLICALLLPFVLFAIAFFSFTSAVLALIRYQEQRLLQAAIAVVIFVVALVLLITKYLFLLQS